MTSVILETDLSKRPEPPRVRPVEAAPLRPPLALVIAIQILVASNILGVLVRHVDWIRNSRPLSRAEEATLLTRSFTVANLGPNAGSLGSLSEVLIVGALLAAAAMVVVGLIWADAGDLVGILSGAVAAMVLVAGLVRLAKGVTATDPWLTYALWLLVVIGATGGGLVAFRRQQAGSSRRYDLLLALLVIAAGAAIPVTFRLGVWGETTRLAPFGAADPNDTRLSAIRVWLCLAGAAPVALGVGYLLLRPPLNRRFALVSGVALIAASLTYLGKIGPDHIELATAQPTQPTATSVAPKVASEPPVPPCLTWPIDASASAQVVVRGVPCVDGEVRQGSATVATARLGADPTAVGPVADALDGSMSTDVVGQVYDGVVVILQPVTDGPPTVVGLSTTTLNVSWTFACPAGTTHFAVRFSGGVLPANPAALRVVQEFYGLTNYVMIKCDEALALHDPLTGTAD